MSKLLRPFTYKTQNIGVDISKLRSFKYKTQKILFDIAKLQRPFKHEFVWQPFICGQEI